MFQFILSYYMGFDRSIGTVRVAFEMHGNLEIGLRTVAVVCRERVR